MANYITMRYGVQAALSATGTEAKNGTDRSKATHKATSIETVAFATGAKPRDVHTAKLTSSEKQYCAYCIGNHFSSKCRKYDTAPKRLEALPEKSCYACLQQGHSVHFCKNRVPCFFCTRTAHHQSLCPQKFGKLELKSTTPNKNSVSKTKQMSQPKQTEATNSGNSDRTKTTDTRLTALAVKEKGNHLTARATISNSVTVNK